MMNWKLWLRKRLPTHVERKILKQIKGKTLDLGCGIGFFLFYCQKRNLDTIGIDIDKEKIKKSKVISIKPVSLGDAHQLPFGDNTFNNIVALDILEHLKNPSQAIKEMNRILKRRGKIFIHIPRGKGVFRQMEGHINFFDDKKEVEKLVERYFKIKKIECVGFKWFIRPPLIPPSYNPFWILSTFITWNLPEFLSTHYYLEGTKR